MRQADKAILETGGVGGGRGAELAADLPQSRTLHTKISQPKFISAEIAICNWCRCENGHFVWCSFK